MKAVIFCSISLFLGQLALAQSVPVLRQGQCPSGTYTSGNSCVPVGDTQVFFVGGGQCPAYFTKSKGYCVR
jgi:hypothetical protein